METSVSVLVDAPRARVWSVISDIANAGATIKGIEKVEVLAQPPAGLVGLKWRETRTMFGKQATEVMWITAAEEARFYDTRAESHGSVYTTRVEVEDVPEGGTRLSMTFRGEPVSLGAKVLGALLGPLMRKSVRDALAKDLADVKAAAEARV